MKIWLPRPLLRLNSLKLVLWWIKEPKVYLVFFSLEMLAKFKGKAGFIVQWYHEISFDVVFPIASRLIQSFMFYFFIFEELFMHVYAMSKLIDFSELSVKKKIRMDVPGRPSNFFPVQELCRLTATRTYPPRSFHVYK